MNILYCGDGNIADGVIMSVISLLKNNKEPINVYILTASVKTDQRECTALSPEFAEKLDSMVKSYGADNSAEMFDITELFAAQPPTANLKTRFTPCCMLRLYADLVDRLPDRLLYLDNDVLCRSDCGEFYSQDIEGLEFCGVLDHYGRWFFKKNIFKFDYINSGVLLLNMAKIRQSGLFRRCRERCADKGMFMPDQSALNKLASSKKICERRYNEQHKLAEDTVFQHFSTSFRFFPWIHTVSVKPWDTERMHSVLKLHEYDAIIDEYKNWKSRMV